jgi:hypothetical protein
MRCSVVWGEVPAVLPRGRVVVVQWNKHLPNTVTSKLRRTSLSELGKMIERQNTIVCFFDPKGTRMSAYDIHEWIHDTMRLTEADVAMVHVDGAKRQVFVKLREFNKM